MFSVKYTYILNVKYGTRARLRCFIYLWNVHISLSHLIGVVLHACNVTVMAVVQCGKAEV